MLCFEKIFTVYVFYNLGRIHDDRMLFLTSHVIAPNLTLGVCDVALMAQGNPSFQTWSKI